MSVYTRRQFATAAAGIGVGLFAMSPVVTGAQEGAAAPDGEAVGFASTRIHTVESAEQREAMNAMIFGGFIKDVQALEGYQGYVLGDVIDAEGQSLSILILENGEQLGAYDDLASEFAGRAEEEVTTVDAAEWAGDLTLVASGRREGRGAPPSSPGAGPLTQGYVVVRIYDSAEGRDPGEAMSVISADFLPIVTGLDGFRGYLAYPTEGGIVAISLFDSEEAATASSEAKSDWVSEHLADQFDGEPEVYHAAVRFASLPVLRHA